MLHQKDQMILEKEKKVQPLACFPHPQHADSWHVHTDHAQTKSSFSYRSQQKAFWLLPGCLLSKAEEAFRTHLGETYFIKGHFPTTLSYLCVGARPRENYSSVQSKSSTLGASAALCSSVMQCWSCCSPPATSVCFQTHLVSGTFCGRVLVGREQPLLPSHALFVGVSADHRAEGRLAVPGVADESKDEPNGEDAQGGHGAVTGDCIFVLIC